MLLRVCIFGGSEVEAVKMFDEITDPDIVSWTERIGAAFDALEAFGLFKSLRHKGEEMLRLGKQIQAICEKERLLKVVFVGNALISISGTGRRDLLPGFKSGFNHDCFVETAVIDLYCKCGNIGDTEKAFRYASIDNLSAWNAVITGYAQHGLVQEAQSYMNSMVECHGLIPHLEHYACMIDLLGQILLSACSIHGNVDRGIMAASKLLELQPDNESAYILLSYLCASAGMWNAVGKLRREMKEKLLCKEPGSSWIQASLEYVFLSCAPGTPANCTGLNISHLVVHDAHRGIFIFFEQLLLLKFDE
ncbi:hypothetical protein CRYUN_Cryun12cG0050000 [Craigia yunnanensis]